VNNVFVAVDRRPRWTRLSTTECEADEIRARCDIRPTDRRRLLDNLCTLFSYLTGLAKSRWHIDFPCSRRPSIDNFTRRINTTTEFKNLEEKPLIALPAARRLIEGTTL